MSEFDPIIVVIATSMKRTDLLLERSLKSVYQQKNVNPSQIFIIDDNSKDDPEDQYSTEYLNIKFRIKQFRENFFSSRFEDGNVPENYFHTTVYPNKRTHGHSGTGAWNTAIYRADMYGRENYIAILDDDDEWDEKYLSQCLEEIKKEENQKIIGVITGINRIEKKRKISLILDEKSFSIKSLLVGNPGFQGSNIFIRLRDLLNIGAFDESLLSATDRDLGLRLIQYLEHEEDLGLFFNKNVLVHHHAENESRVTSSNKNKKKGLDLFYRKYKHFMDDNILKESLNRAQKLFNYSISDVFEDTICPENNIELHGYDNVNIIIGLISDNPENVKEFLFSFSQVPDQDLLNDYRIVILENTNNEFRIRPIIHYFKEIIGIRIDFLSVDRQKDLLNKYPFKKHFNHETVEKKSIAFSRSLLQYYCYQKSEELFNKENIVWIIDDDLSFQCLQSENEKITILSKEYFKSIAYLYARRNTDAILGTVVDAPPLPFLSSLRTQLLDIHFNLQWFSKQNPEDKFDRSPSMNYPLSKGNRDFYYDLSSCYYTQLECPFWWIPIEDEPTSIRKAFHSFIKDIALFHKGTNICRPIILDPNSWCEIEGPSIFRGGNTIIFDLEMLKVPNMVPVVDYQGNQISPRRSDFNWAMINKYVFGKDIKQIIIPMRHHRRLQNSLFSYNRDKLVRDIYGMIFYRVMNNLFEKGIDNLEDRDYVRAKKKFDKMFRHYLSNLKINMYRSQTLVRSILRILENEKNWWYDNKYRESLNDELLLAISSMKSIYFKIEKRSAQDLTDNLDYNFKNIDEDVFRDFVTSIKRIR